MLGSFRWLRAALSLLVVCDVVCVAAAAPQHDAGAHSRKQAMQPADAAAAPAAPDPDVKPLQLSSGEELEHLLSTHTGNVTLQLRSVDGIFQPQPAPLAHSPSANPAARNKAVLWPLTGARSKPILT